MERGLFDKLPEILHDRKIISISHEVSSPVVKIFLNNDQIFRIAEVVIFRSESYLNKGVISADGVYISGCSIQKESWLIKACIEREKPDGAKKWGDRDRPENMLRDNKLIHINLYCVDWEFDIVCKSVSFTDYKSNE
jgi:hypothetical protein